MMKMLKLVEVDTILVKWNDMIQMHDYHFQVMKVQLREEEEVDDDDDDRIAVIVEMNSKE
jgi:hypothetical protein